MQRDHTSQLQPLPPWNGGDLGSTTAFTKTTRLPNTRRPSRPKLTSQELLSSRQTLLRERISQQDQVYIIQNANQELSSSCQTLLRERTSQQNHDYILQRHANQELLSSRQTLLRERMKQQDHIYIIQNANKSTLALPNPAQGANELAKPRLKFKHATSWALAKTLLRERLNSKTTFYKCASQEHSSSCQDLAQGRESTRPRLHHSDMQTLGILPKPCCGSD